MWANNRTIILISLLLMAACDQHEALPSLPVNSPTGVVWKLEGFGSMNGQLEIAEPNLDKNYQLLLESDNNAYGISSINYLAGKYSLDKEKQMLTIDMQILTDALDILSGELYFEHLSKVFRYELQDNVLRLYYSGQEYLQYHPASDESHLREIVNNFAPQN